VSSARRWQAEVCFRNPGGLRLTGPWSARDALVPLSPSRNSALAIINERGGPAADRASAPPIVQVCAGTKTIEELAKIEETACLRARL